MCCEVLDHQASLKELTVAVLASGFSPVAQSPLEDRGQLWGNERWGDLRNKVGPNIPVSVPRNGVLFQHQNRHFLLSTD